MGHEARPTAPYEEATWETLLSSAVKVDQRLDELGVTLTMGGEPTFCSRLHPDEPEWNGEALGPTKTAQGRELALELRRRLMPGGLLLQRMGKQYPGVSLPRWVIDLVARSDEQSLWPDRPNLRQSGSLAAAEQLAKTIAQPLEVALPPIAAFEDPWQVLLQ